MDEVFVGIDTGPGMGMSTAWRFVREGFDLVLTSTDASKLAGIAEQLRRGTGRSVETISLDATNFAAVQELADRFSARVRVLHYNAAVLEKTDVFATSVETFHHHLQVDVTGAFGAIRCFAPKMEGMGKGTILLTRGGWPLLRTQNISH